LVRCGSDLYRLRNNTVLLGRRVYDVLRSLWFRLSTSEPDLIPIKPRLFLQYAPISCVPV